MKGLIRGIFTLLGVLGAGFLIWIASQFDLDRTSEFWAAMGIIAGAGAVLGLSQLLGGWTKWGWPRISPGVFLLGFLPTLVLVGGILLATRDTGQGTRDEVSGWAGTLGVSGFAADIALFQGALAFTLGLVFSFIFDTTGPRTRIVTREPGVPDEDVHDYRRDETTVAEELRAREDHETSSAGAGSSRDDRVEIHDPTRRPRP